VAAATPRVDQGPPQRIARCERLAHDQAQPPVAKVAAGNLACPLTLSETTPSSVVTKIAEDSRHAFQFAAQIVKR
jgi:hypothetical protein